MGDAQHVDSIIIQSCSHSGRIHNQILHTHQQLQVVLFKELPLAARNPYPPLAVPIVEVVWLDAMLEYTDRQSAAPVTAEELAANTEIGTINRSVGYLVHQDEQCVRIAMEATHGTGEGFRDVLTIPTSLVRRVKKMR